jgi:hypothetical protein
MKKPRTVADLLTVANVCIKTSKVRARLLDSRNKGHAKKKQQKDRVVNAADRRN